MIDVAKDRCQQCGTADEPKIVYMDSGTHFAKLICVGCERFIRWLPKPGAEKVRRPQSHRNLVDQFGKGFCELCLRRREALPFGETLEAQHVIEFQDGGPETRDNIWIVCTSCHKLIHWCRTYHGINRKRTTGVA